MPTSALRPDAPDGGAPSPSEANGTPPRANGRLSPIPTSRAGMLLLTACVLFALAGCGYLLSASLNRIDSRQPLRHFAQSRETMLLHGHASGLQRAVRQTLEAPEDGRARDALSLALDRLYAHGREGPDTFGHPEVDAQAQAINKEVKRLVALGDRALQGPTASEAILRDIDARAAALQDALHRLFDESGRLSLGRLEEQARALDSLRASLLSLLTLIGLIAFGLLVLIAGQRRMLARQRAAQKEAARAKRQLQDAVESINDGFALFDPEERLVLCNSRYAAIHRSIAEILRPGVRYEEMLWAQAVHTPAALAGEDPRHWVQHHLQHHRAAAGKVEEVQIEPGRWVLASEHRTQDGSVVGTRTDVTVLKQREQELRQSKDRADQAEARLRAAIESISDAFLLWDRQERLVLVNDRYREFYPEIAEELRPGMERWRLARLLHRIDRGDERDPVDHLQPPKFGQPVERCLANGRWVRVSEHRTADGGVVSVQTDITELKKREVALKQSQDRYRVLASTAPVGIWHLDHGGRTRYANDAVAELLDLRQASELRAFSIRDFLEENQRAYALSRFKRVVEGEEATFEIELIGAKGRVVNVLVSAVPLRQRGRLTGSILATLLDITERKRVEAKIQHIAHHDALTNLPNRVLFVQRLERTMRLAAASGRPFAVLGLDLDHFKDVNDSLGHAVGDKLLQQVAARLRNCVRSTDTIARLGGDEFAIILSGEVEPTAVVGIAQKINQSLGQPFNIDGQKVHTGTSIGIAVYPNDSEDADELMRYADMALYEAKQAGRRGYAFFTADMSAQIFARKRMETDLRDALTGGKGLHLHYQPQLCLRSGRIVGVEALVRWRHEEFGTIPPSDFIPIAESTGLILPLGAWVLREACHQARRWSERGLPALRVAVNLSPIQFKQPKLPDLVEDVLRQTDLPAARLELEITEGVLVNDSRGTRNTLQRLRDLGVLLAIDDFGTGFSSLNYLKRFPAHKIKIDQSFVRDLGRSEGDDAIVNAVITLGRSLGMAVIAEGVETEEQLAVLRAKGCDEAQGYLIGCPVDADRFARALAGAAGGEPVRRAS